MPQSPTELTYELPKFYALKKPQMPQSPTQLTYELPRHPFYFDVRTDHDREFMQSVAKFLYSKGNIRKAIDFLDAVTSTNEKEIIHENYGGC